MPEFWWNFYDLVRNPDYLLLDFIFFSLLCEDAQSNLMQPEPNLEQNFENLVNYECISPDYECRYFSFLLSENVQPYTPVKLILLLTYAP